MLAYFTFKLGCPGPSNTLALGLEWLHGGIIHVQINMIRDLDNAALGSKKWQERIRGNEIESKWMSFSVHNEVHQVTEGNGICGLTRPEINSQ